MASSDGVVNKQIRIISIVASEISQESFSLILVKREGKNCTRKKKEFGFKKIVKSKILFLVFQLLKFSKNWKRSKINGKSP